MKKLITIGSTILASFLIVGCGSASPSTSSTANGFYVDAAIQGVDYVCGESRGVTEKDGKFTFEKNKNCTFKVGSVLLREVGTSFQVILSKTYTTIYNI